MTDMTFTEPTAEVVPARTPGPTKATPMTHCNLMMQPTLLARLDRLRACLGVSRSRVVEMVLTEITLDTAERRNAAGVKRFGALATEAGVDWVRYARAYAATFARQTYPPAVPLLADISKGADFRKALQATLAEMDN